MCEFEFPASKGIKRSIKRNERVAKLKEKLKRKVEREIEKAEKKREKSPLVEARTSFTFVPPMKIRRGMTESDGTRKGVGGRRENRRTEVG